MADDFSFKITRHIGVLSTSGKGWTTELNMVSWSEREPKYDIRSWDPQHEKMSKGITLTKDELSQLGKLINQEN